MTNSKNIFIDKPEKTDVSVTADSGLVINVPDNKYAYGDTQSVAQIAGDLATKHSGNSDAAGKRAYEQAREQLETTDWKNERYKRAAAKIAAKRPQYMTHFLKDNTGEIIGVEILMTLTDPDTGFVEYKNVVYSKDELEKMA
tara:strand:+ start:190 stop:615 length:426 start_codon:yes stop_codon:yes gene_type:complete